MYAGELNDKNGSKGNEKKRYFFLKLIRKPQIAALFEDVKYNHFMKQLDTLLRGISVLEVIGFKNLWIKTIQFEVDKVTNGDMFFALIGYGIDPHDFIPKVIQQGARVIVCEYFPKEIDEGVVYLKVRSTHEAIGMAAANYYDHPTKKMKVVGITGTNGKTSTATLLHQLFRKLGYKVGLLSTVTNKINDLSIFTKKTTPHALDIHRLCKKMVDEQCEYCFMEASSHGIYQERVLAIHFAGAAFTNITHDHLDYHGSFEAYFKVKKSFLDQIDKASFVVCNVDDSNSKKITTDVKAQLKTLSTKNENADFYCKIAQDTLSGLVIELENKQIHLQLRAAFNAYNILTTYAIAVLLGADKSKVLNVLPQLQPIEGRFNAIQSKNKVIGIVDYAHTPDALINVYATLTQLKTTRLITIIGCGGDKDKKKRPVMAGIAYQNSDILILTSDNPRSESPQQIIDDMLAGLVPDPINTSIILDRKSAIQYACRIAQSQDIILLAGKGHETYQEIKGVRYDFNDKALLLEMLNQ